MIIDARLQFTHQNCIQSYFAELLDRLQFCFQQRRTSQGFIAGIVKRIELKIDLRSMFLLGNDFEESPIACDANPIRVAANSPARSEMTTAIALEPMLPVTGIQGSVAFGAAKGGLHQHGWILPQLLSATTSHS